jgi:c-di-GMP-binding flagellar brake protein YcgR
MAKQISPEQIKKMNQVAVGSALADISLTVISSIAQAGDARKQQEFKNYLSNLSDDQQNQLVNAINNAKNEEDKIALISMVFNNATAKRVENLSNILIREEQENRQKRVEKIILGSLLGAMVIVLIYLKRKK